MTHSLLSILPPPQLPRQGFPWDAETQAPAPEATPPQGWPTITIIVPSYNQGSFLEENLRSILLQNYPATELLVMDGGSTDSTPQVIKKYAPWISYYQIKKDKGNWDAINQALDRMTGQYWMVVNSDDLLVENGLYHVAHKIMEHHHPDWLNFGTYMLNQHSERTRLIHREGFKTKPVAGLHFLNGAWIFHPSTVLSAKLFKQTGYFEPVHSLDAYYWVAAEKQGFFPLCFKEPVGALRFHDDCKTETNLDALRQEIMDLLARRKSELPGDRNAIKALNTIWQREKLEWYYARLLKKEGNKVRLMLGLLTLDAEQILKRRFWGMVKQIITRANTK